MGRQYTGLRGGSMRAVRWERGGPEQGEDDKARIVSRAKIGAGKTGGCGDPAGDPQGGEWSFGV
jgi:hypothetical protein